MTLKIPHILKIGTIVDLLTYLIGLVAYFSIFKEIHIIYVMVFLSLFAYSVVLTYSDRLVAKRWMLNAISVGVIMFSVYRFDVNDLITKMTEALLILLSIKFLEQKKGRDYMQIFAISLLLVAGSGLLSLSVAFLGFFFITVFILTLAAIFLSYYSQDQGMLLSSGVVAKVVRNSLVIPLTAIPLTAIMFLVLPRTNYPLFDFLKRHDAGRTGFSDNVKLGAVSSIQEDSAAAFRANMEKTTAEYLYWRGVVLDCFDGVTWKRTEQRTRTQARGAAAGRKLVKQTIYLEPSDNRYLFALDKPVAIFFRDARQIGDNTFFSSSYSGGRIRYEAHSALSEWIPEMHIDRERFLQLPNNVSANLWSLAKRMSQDKTEIEKISTFFNFLKNGSFRYSLDNLPVTPYPLDTFLFHTRYGNCEYFASALAMMLRISGVPARIVGGYRGGYYNRVGSYYLVPQKNAHVWVEAHVKEKGWLRIDPTPVVRDGLMSQEESILSGMNVFFDTINYYWYVFVINYNLEKQLFFVRSIRSAFKKPNFELSLGKEDVKHFKWVAAAMAFVASCFLIRVRLRRRTAEEKILASFLGKMERNGHIKEDYQGLEEFALSIEDERVRDLALRFARQFESSYFRDKSLGRDEKTHLREIIRSI